MGCFSPLSAFRTAEGGVVFAERGDIDRRIELPCGRCIGCRIERARQWTVRIMHEASLYEDNAFVTLTYDDAHLGSPSLQYGDFQGALKRLRSRVSAHSPGRKIRFFVVGEYGAELQRPHFHACLFNYGFPDRVVWRDFGSGSVAYRSAELEACWPFGFSSVGELTRKSAAYCARYVLDKVTGEPAKDHYSVVDEDTGEVTWKVPELVRMSLKPGIGAGWFEKYGRHEVGVHDRCVVDGVVTKPPRYYDTLLGRVDPQAREDGQQSRIMRAMERAADNTPARLAVKEQVTKARLSQLKRKQL